MISWLYAAQVPARLDQVLLEHLKNCDECKDITRSQLKRWIAAGRVRLAGELVSKAGTEVKPGVQVEVEPLVEDSSALAPLAMALEVLHEDEDLIVVHKPAGLSMHPGAGNRTHTLANALVAHFGKDFAQHFAGDAQQVQRPGIVHRLDKDTTGVVVVAKNVRVQFALARQFAARSVERRYLALALCAPRGTRALRVADQGRIETQFGRNPQRPLEMAVLTQGGKKAITHWQVQQRFSHAALVEIRLETGRTHQIRVHLAHLGCPVIGDTVYGNFDTLSEQLRRLHAAFGRQALHAAVLGFTHPRTGAVLRFERALPQDFLDLIAGFTGVV